MRVAKPPEALRLARALRKAARSSMKPSPTQRFALELCKEAHWAGTPAGRAGSFEELRRQRAARELPALARRGGELGLLPRRRFVAPAAVIVAGLTLSIQKHGWPGNVTMKPGHISSFKPYTDAWSVKMWLRAAVDLGLVVEHEHGGYRLGSYEGPGARELGELLLRDFLRDLLRSSLRDYLDVWAAEQAGFDLDGELEELLAKLQAAERGGGRRRRAGLPSLGRRSLKRSG